MINLDNFSSILVANWKLNGNKEFIKEYYQKLIPSNSNCVVICSPSIFLTSLPQNNKNLFSGAQDISSYKQGAYTGELSASMLYDNNIHFCIVGHSERRNYFRENNAIINSKSINLIENKIIPIVCVGETLEEKEKNLTKNVLSNQIKESIPSISNHQNTIIAYEPIWAIGTGLTPSLKDIEAVHSHIKNIDKRFNKFKVLYGGSVKNSNSADIKSLKNVDGCLIGGASLKVDEFNTIIS
jgi:triosephosphate isomerase